MTEWPFWSPCPCLIVKFYPRSPNGTWTLGPSTFDWFWSHFDRVNLNISEHLLHPQAERKEEKKEGRKEGRLEWILRRELITDH